MSEEIEKAIKVMFAPDAVVELRAFKERVTVSGYFDDDAALAGEAAKLNGRGFAVYTTLNPVNPELLARSANKIKNYPKATTSDTDVLARRWLPVDFDPVRPADLSSTDAEKRAALLRAREVRDYLKEQGWPEPVVGDSGNGAHLLYPVDLPNDRESLVLVQGALETLAFKFSDEAVSVDTSVYNAARIWKLYGTIARKGDDVPKRPHRASKLLSIPEGIGPELVEREMLQKMAAAKVHAPPRDERRRSDATRNGYGEFELTAWIEKHGIPVKREGVWEQGGYRWVLEECPWNGHTDNSTYIVQAAHGGIAAGCHHNSCSGYGWHDLREHYEPGAYERRRVGEDNAPPPDDFEAAMEKKSTQAELLIRYADNVELFHTPDGEEHATIEVGDHKENWPLKSRRFEQWLLRQFYEEQGKAPGSQTLTEAKNTIAARAVFEGSARRVFTRVAKHGDAIYLDLCNDRWEVVEITPDGWNVISSAKTPVKFVRKNNAAALPHPVTGGTVELLRRLLNVRTDEDFMLLVAWAIGTFNPDGPYPCLALQGQQGSAKTTTVRVLRSVTDPAHEPLRAPPRNERDLAIAASGNWTPALDNISGIPRWLSDALCRLATGGGFATRELYSDDEEVIFSQKRPIILNGIYNLTVADDLRDRSIVLELPRISEEERRSEMEFYRELEEARPGVLGALLDAVSAALCNQERVQLKEKPRMADFAIWVAAAAEALGWESELVMRAYTGNRNKADAAALDVEPVAVAVRALMHNREEWAGTATEMLNDLGRHVGEDVKRSKAWPKAPNSLAERLKRLAPALRREGIEYNAEDRTGHAGTRVKTLKWIDPEKYRQHRQREGDPARTSGKHADDGADGAGDGSHECRQHEMPTDGYFAAVADDADDGIRGLSKNTRKPLSETTADKISPGYLDTGCDRPMVRVVSDLDADDMEEFLNATEIVMRTKDLGIRLNVEADKIQVRPASKLTPELRTAIKENKERLIFDVLMRDALHYLAEHYVEGADLTSLSGSVHDEVCNAYGEQDLERLRAALRKYVRIGLKAFRAAGRGAA